MDAQGVNPYQPVVIESESVEASPDVSFVITPASQRHAESQHILHWHSTRLVVGSFAMIAVSGWAIAQAATYSIEAFFATLVAAMLVSALIYLSLVHHTKHITRESQASLGLVRGSTCAASADYGRLRLTTPHGAFKWRIEQVRAYRTSQGLLLCPQPYLYIFIPKQCEPSKEAYRAISQVWFAKR